MEKNICKALDELILELTYNITPRSPVWTDELPFWARVPHQALEVSKVQPH
jgi:hypothetical protein